MASWHSVAGNHRAGFAETLAFLNEFGTIRTNRAFGGFVPIFVAILAFSGHLSGDFPCR
jgi:hypothetical protein